MSDERKINNFEEKKLFIEFIDHCRSNRHLLSEIRDNIGGVTPLVGAGLSREFGFPNWTEFFEKACESCLNPEGKNYKQIKQFLGKISTRQLPPEGMSFHMKMADHLCSELKEGFCAYLERIFPTIGAEKIKQSTAHEVAKMFNGRLCLTTNFDCVMETAFAQEGRTDVFSPGSEDKIKHHIKQNSGKANFLFHLHGFIKHARSNPKSIVLTTKSYNAYYSNPTKSNFLSQLNNETIFYLGIGLENEEPFIAYFKKKLPKGIAYHFAIHSATKEEAEKRYKNLVKQKIQSLIYPKGKYPYVKYILNWLKKENPTDKDIQKWRQEMDKVFDWPPIDYSDTPTGYLYKLGQFLDTKERFLFAEVSGGKLSGKTRLAEELKKKAEDKKWAVRIINQNNIDTLLLPITPDYHNQLYIFDDAITFYRESSEANDGVSDYLTKNDADKFCKYLFELAQTKEKVRIVFLYTPLENSSKWWENSIRDTTGVGSYIHSWRENITLEFHNESALKVISDFAKMHKNTDDNIKKCIEIWPRFINSTPSNIREMINTPQGCMLVTYIWLSDEEDGFSSIDFAKIKKKALNSFVNLGLSKQRANKEWIRIKKYYKEFFNLITPRESAGTASVSDGLKSQGIEPQKG